MTEHDSNKLAEIAQKVRRDVIRMQRLGTGVASAMSVVDILVCLYFEVLSPSASGEKERDHFLLSKGHGVAALYATLAARGIIDSSLLDHFLEDGSPLTGHPARGSVPGIEVSTGSLGHGLPIAVGLAWAAKLAGRTSRVFVLHGDGELQEGSVWEGAALASRLGLDNLVAMVDVNGLQGYGRVDELTPLDRFADKWRSFGWETIEIDGHDHARIVDTLKACPFVAGKPSVILARTVKGKGVKAMEDQLGWHYFSVPADRIEPFLEELS
ncbi:MAG: transketolase [Proteobacteria bacterium]|nr:transketolase [Pseudomonadota bacterium]MBU1687337.1 transketolase [Pseudomonadota bacterium]